MIGQCLLEKSIIVLTQTPKDYIKITSGLGEAVPQYVIVLPLMIREDIMGIVEMASFEPLASYQVDFLRNISENIASILYNKNINIETARLLTQAQEQAQQLSSQEEEIRQNTEEMQAIMEQMEREKKSMEEEIVDLKSKLTLHHSV